MATDMRRPPDRIYVMLDDDGDIAAIYRSERDARADAWDAYGPRFRRRRPIILRYDRRRQ
jgi:hypothetical protein